MLFDDDYVEEVPPDRVVSGMVIFIQFSIILAQIWPMCCSIIGGS